MVTTQKQQPWNCKHGKCITLGNWRWGRVPKSYKNVVFSSYRVFSCPFPPHIKNKFIIAEKDNLSKITTAEYSKESDSVHNGWEAAVVGKQQQRKGFQQGLWKSHRRHRVPSPEPLDYVACTNQTEGESVGMHDGTVLVLCRLSAWGRDAEDAPFTSLVTFLCLG